MIWVAKFWEFFCIFSETVPESTCEDVILSHFFKQKNQASPTGSPGFKSNSGQWGRQEILYACRYLGLPLRLDVDRCTIIHFTVACSIAKPLNRSEAKGVLLVIQTSLFFKCELFCYYANLILVSITTRSLSASLQMKGLATKYTTVKMAY